MRYISFVLVKLATISDVKMFIWDFYYFWFYFQKFVMFAEVQTITTYLLGFLAIVLLYCFWYFQKIYNHWKKRDIPYLKPTLPFGNLLQVYTKKCQIGEAFANIYYELKRMGVKHGGAYALISPVYIPIDPNIIKHIIANDANNFINHGYYQDSETDPLSAHLFNMEGNQWRSVRTKITHAYTVAKLKKMFVTMVEGAKKFEEHLELCRMKEPEGINVKKEILKLTTDTMMKVSYGMETNTMKDDNQELLKELHNFIIDQWTLYKNTMVFLFPRKILRLLKFRLFSKESNEYTRKLFVGLQKYRREFKVFRDDLADILISMTEKTENQTNTTVKELMKPLTENEFIAQMWVFVGAGSESAATTISFALYELSKNPSCQTKLREEIINILSKHDNELSFEALKEMNYLDYVINGKYIFTV